ncbi:hypothetical protein ACFSC6_11015 [Rufibacter sediminis]|uniref:Uncharacterized protein n=1 Tax=Rufibacter sediminis TaxID=2762756 RepID=A0ABR6VUX7_9BACT|nr:hypothetical protein [Rufibacter sediminis]MBC3540411.1 hypothetical protein [Rufibacter sediminis]
MKTSLLIIICFLALSCSSEKQSETQLVENSNSSNTKTTDEPLNSQPDFSPDSAKMESVEVSSDKGSSSLIEGKGETCEIAMMRADSLAIVAMNRQRKPCYKAATDCRYDAVTKLYYAYTHLRNHIGSCT